MSGVATPSLLRDGLLGFRDWLPWPKQHQPASRISGAADDEDLLVEDDDAECAESDAERQRLARIHARNILVGAGAALPGLTPMFGLAVIESSINSSHGLGQLCLALVYGLSVVSVTFLTPIMLRRFGPPNVLRMCLVPLVFFVAAHYKVTPALFLSACALQGLFLQMFLVCISVLCTSSAIEYARLRGVDRTVILNKVSGLLFFALAANFFTGPLISSLVLRNPVQLPGNDTQDGGGGMECDDSEKKLEINTGDRYILLSVFIGLVVVGFGALFLIRPVQQSAIKAKLATASAWQKITATVRLLGDFDMLFLVPIFFYAGMTKEVISANFTEFFVSPCLGVGSVGYVVACFGATYSLTAGLMSSVLKHTGRPAMAAVAALCNLSVVLTLLFWRRTPNAPLLYGMAGLWGVANGIWSVELTVMVGLLYPNRQEAAFSNYRVWLGIGFAVSAIYSQRIGRCKEQLRTKLYFLLALLALVLALLSVLEWRLRRKKDRQAEGQDAQPAAAAADSHPETELSRL